MNYQWVIIAAWAVWNIFVFALYGRDKQKSKQGRWRTQESTLLICAALMGAAGAFLGMRLFRHKTKHPKFRVGVPLLLLLNIALAAVLIYWL